MLDEMEEVKLEGGCFRLGLRTLSERFRDHNTITWTTFYEKCDTQKSYHLLHRPSMTRSTTREVVGRRILPNTRKEPLAYNCMVEGQDICMSLACVIDVPCKCTTSGNTSDDLVIARSP